MRTFKQFVVSIMCLALLFMAVPANAAGLNATSSPVTISFSVGESLTISATPASVTLVPSGSQYTGAATPITVTTNWNVTSTRNQLYVCQQLTQGTLPGVSTNYQSSVNGGATSTFGGSSGNWCAGNQVPPQAGDVLSLPLTSANDFGSNTSTVVISTVGLSNVAVGTYSGSITFTAFIMP